MAFGSTRLSYSPGSITVESPTAVGSGFTLYSCGSHFVPAALASGLNWLDDTERLEEDSARHSPSLFCIAVGTS